MPMIRVTNSIRTTRALAIGAGLLLAAGAACNVKTGGDEAPASEREADHTCPKGNCDVTCQGSETCRATCSGGTCKHICQGEANCTFTCSGGNCDQICQGKAECNATCSGGNCKQTCDGDAKCDFSCSGKNCS